MVETYLLKWVPEDAIFLVEYRGYAKFLTVGKYCPDSFGLEET